MIQTENQTQTRAQKRIVLGEIVGAHGLHGEIRLRIVGDGPDALLGAEALWIGSGPGDPEARRIRVKGCGPGRKGEVRLRFDGIESREKIAALVGLVAMASTRLLPDLPEGEYYQYELIGCHVESETGEVAGTVKEIWETGAHDVLVVEDEDGVRRLIPTAEALMKSVDLAAGRIVVADLPGLLEPV